MFTVALLSEALLDLPRDVATYPALDTVTLRPLSIKGEGRSQWPNHFPFS
jgi:hypothetical protein